MKSEPVVPHWTRVAKLAAGALALALLAGCGGQSTDTVTPLGGPVAETVNGEAVSEKLVEAFAARRNLDMSKPQLRERVLKQIADFVLLAQAAKQDGYMDDADVLASAELGRLQGIAAATMKKTDEGAKVDDAALRAEYDRQYPGGGTKLYDFGQLSFATEDDARKAATEIATGKTFDQAMEEHRKDARVARNFAKMRAEQLQAPLLTTLDALQPGASTAAPLQLTQGWSLLHLGTTSTVPAPPFDKVEGLIKRSLSKRLGQERLTKLRADAKITVNEAAAPAAADAKPAAPPAATMSAPAAAKPANPAKP